jgi:hypothetical protein
MADPELTEAAQVLNRGRWGNRVAVRAAQLVIERAAELPPDVAAEVTAAIQEIPGPGDALPLVPDAVPDPGAFHAAPGAARDAGPADPEAA